MGGGGWWGGGWGWVGGGGGVALWITHEQVCLSTCMGFFSQMGLVKMIYQNAVTVASVCFHSEALKLYHHQVTLITLEFLP